MNLTRADGSSRSATPRTVRLPTRVLILLPFFIWMTGSAWPSDRWNSMSRWDRVCRDMWTETNRWDMFTDTAAVRGCLCVTHLVVRKAVVVGDKQRWLDRQVTETLHEKPPWLRHLRVVQDLLQIQFRTEINNEGFKAETSGDRSSMFSQLFQKTFDFCVSAGNKRLTVKKLEKVGVDWRTCSRFPVQLKPSPT